MLLLIDGDELLYRVLAGLEREVNWSGQVWSTWVSVEDARGALQERLGRLQDRFQPTQAVVAFSGPDNFRLAVLPAYKSNRHGTRKPLGFAAFKEEFLEGKWDGFPGHMKPGLEADDVLGILATKPGNHRHVIISQDKDFLGVPCKVFRAPKGIPGGLPQVHHVTELEADRWHLLQTLMGDKADGYDGCKGLGETRAAKLLEGARAHEWWPKVKAAYAKAGHTPEELLQQARVARILRWTDYDHEKGEPILWTPP